MKTQNEQLERISKKLDDLGSNTDRAKAELKKYMNNLRKDYCLIAFVCIIVLLMAIVLGWRLFGSQIVSAAKGGTATTSAPSTTTPSPT
jgi:t-SNARE complex subunit (syntaxin)